MVQLKTDFDLLLARFPFHLTLRDYTHLKVSKYLRRHAKRNMLGACIGNGRLRYHLILMS